MMNEREGRQLRSAIVLKRMLACVMLVIMLSTTINLPTFTLSLKAEENVAQNAAESTALDAAKATIQEGLLSRSAEIVITLEGDALTGVTTDDLVPKAEKLYADARKHIAYGEAGSNAKLGDYITWSTGEYSIVGSYVTNGGDIVSVTYTYQVEYYTNKAQEDFVDSKLSELYTSLQLTDSSLTDMQKVYKIYNWITNNVSYDYDNLYNDAHKTKYTAYGALTDGQAVCQGFANLFYRMCMDNGIDCRIVTGDANGPHAWNIVKVADAYYYVDSTWDCKVIEDTTNGRQEKPGTVFYFLRDSLANHTEDALVNVTADYNMAKESLAGLQIDTPADVTKDTLSGSVTLKDLCGTAFTPEQSMWYRTVVTTDATDTCKNTITVSPAVVGLTDLVLSQAVVYTHQDANTDYACDVCGKKLKYIVAGYKYDENGNEVSGNMTGLGSFAENEEVTLVAPAVTGYNFIGWYRYDASAENTKHYTGEVLCTTRTYSFTVTEDTSLVAVYKPTGEASVTIDGGSSYTVNGDGKSTSTTITFPIGSKVTVISNDANFEYWKNNAGMVVSRNKEYTFTVTGTETLSAVINNVIAEKATILFESYYGQVMARDQLASGGSMTIPGVPTRYGHTALGWDFNGDGVYDAGSDTLEAAITRGFNSTNNLVKVTPVYQVKEVAYVITVTNGTGSGNYRQNEVVTAVADAAPAGQKFSHWKDASDKILSYNEMYQFFAAKNTMIEAVYVPAETLIQAVGTTEIVDYYKDTQNNKLVFVSMSTVPEGCTIDKAGVIATKDSAVGQSGEGFNASTAEYVLGNAWSDTSYRYTLSIGNVTAGTTWYVRAYLVYTDGDGNVHTIYGKMVSQTY